MKAAVKTFGPLETYGVCPCENYTFGAQLGEVGDADDVRRGPVVLFSTGTLRTPSARLMEISALPSSKIEKTCTFMRTVALDAHGAWLRLDAEVEPLGVLTEQLRHEVAQAARVE